MFFFFNFFKLLKVGLFIGLKFFLFQFGGCLPVLLEKVSLLVTVIEEIEFIGLFLFSCFLLNFLLRGFEVVLLLLLDFYVGFLEVTKFIFFGVQLLSILVDLWIFELLFQRIIVRFFEIKLETLLDYRVNCFKFILIIEGSSHLVY